jgi:hypothetical protein
VAGFGFSVKTAGEHPFVSLFPFRARPWASCRTKSRKAEV